MITRFAKLRAAVLLGSCAVLSACGGSSSETPYPLEPVPHSVKPLKHNQSGSGGDAAAAPSPEAEPSEAGPAEGGPLEEGPPEDSPQN